MTFNVKSNRAWKLAAGTALVVIGVLLAAYAWLQHAPRRVPNGQPPLVTVSPGGLEPIRAAFNAGGGQVRILAMLSPT